MSITNSREFTINVGKIAEAEKLDAISILDNGKAIDISQLTSLVKQSSFIVANDTGPAHLAAHLGCRGLALFGSHTTPDKVSIETGSFLSISSKNISNISIEEVFDKIDSHL